MAPRGYALCAAPRSGTNYLCQLLASTGVLGRPLEYFNGESRRLLDWPDYPDDPQLQLKAVLERGSTPNGVYGLKVFAYQADMAADTGWPTALPNLSFIRLRRMDRLGQAISWARAEQTQSYRSTVPPRGEPAYDARLIYRRLRDVIREEARWSLYFARIGVSPLELTYESLVAGPQTVAAAVTALMGVRPAPAIDPAAVDVQPQRDALNQLWRTRFIEEHGDPARVDRLGGKKAAG